MAAYSRAALIPAALLLVAAHKPGKPSGELILDAANPVVAVEIAGVPLRLRVDLDQQNSIELNPAIAASLPVRWQKGMEMDVGRVRLESRIAPAELRIEGRVVPSQVSEHGRDCCIGSDGAVSPDLLPFATVRWRRATAPASNGALAFPLASSAMTGLSTAAATPGIRLRFAFNQAVTVGTGAAGARLAQLWHGDWGGPATLAKLAFGVARPARPIAFAQPGTLAGFRIDSLLVRISDFSGTEELPADPPPPGDIVIAQPLAHQHAWPAVTIGMDRLSRCAEIVYSALPRTLTLHCAFDEP